MKLLHVLLQPKPCSESRECKQMHAHANTHTTPSLHTRTHKHTCSLSLVSVGDQLFCRLHSAAVAAARAPRLRSRSYSAAAERQKQVQKGAFRALLGGSGTQTPLAASLRTLRLRTRKSLA